MRRATTPVTPGAKVKARESLKEKVSLARTLVLIRGRARLLKARESLKEKAKVATARTRMLALMPMGAATTTSRTVMAPSAGAAAVAVEVAMTATIEVKIAARMR